MKITSYLKNFTFLSFGLPSQVDSHPFQICQNRNFLGFSKLNLNPDPPEIGNNLVVTLQGKTMVPITQGATLHVDLSTLGIKIGEKQFDLCQDLNLNCPLAVNSYYSGNFTYQIPPRAPEGLTLEVHLKTYQTGPKPQLSSCLALETTLVKKVRTRDINSKTEDLDLELNPNPNRDYSYDAFRQSENLFFFWQQQHQWKFTSLLDYVEHLDQFHINNLAIQAHNAKSDQTFRLGHNQFSHLSNQEFRSLATSKIKPSTQNQDTGIRYFCQGEKRNNLWPTQVDWSKTGAVSSVKNQGNCGSCWAFSTTGAMEGAYYVKTGNSVSFSEQQLVSCDKQDQGCQGGLMTNAYSWIQKQGGLCQESDYPYQSGSGGNFSCQNQCHPIPNSQVSQYVEVNASEVSLLQAVAKQPVSIAIEADGINFQLYRDGVLTSKCGTNLDHGVLVVGFGQEQDTDYWLVKNSWGSSWGENGYIKLARDVAQKGGQCGILLSASYPILS